MVNNFIFSECLHTILPSVFVPSQCLMGMHPLSTCMQLMMEMLNQWAPGQPEASLPGRYFSSKNHALVQVQVLSSFNCSSIQPMVPHISHYECQEFCRNLGEIYILCSLLPHDLLGMTCLEVLGLLLGLPLLNVSTHKWRLMSHSGIFLPNNINIPSLKCMPFVSFPSCMTAFTYFSL